MKIACLSGKGGAGKTMVAVNLAAAAGSATYIDCDVEEPNGHLFLQPQNVREEIIFTTLPEFDGTRCNGCKACVDFCKFHALVYVKEKPMLFSEVCHSCGGCQLVCPEQAVSERKKPIGKLLCGQSEGIQVVTGMLNPGESSGVPVIQSAIQYANGFTIFDAPPGSACSVMETVMASDYCILVVEPTVFGFHNFQMVYELVRLLRKRCGVVVNKEETRFELLERFCEEHSIPILARIPYDQDIATMIASGRIVIREHSQMRKIFEGILLQIGGSI